MPHSFLSENRRLRSNVKVIVRACLVSTQPGHRLGQESQVLLSALADHLLRLRLCLRKYAWDQPLQQQVRPFGDPCFAYLWWRPSYIRPACRKTPSAQFPLLSHSDRVFRTIVAPLLCSHFPSARARRKTNVFRHVLLTNNPQNTTSEQFRLDRDCLSCVTRQPS